MSLRAGALRERVQIQSLARSRDDQGGYSATQTYTTITRGTVWAQVENLDSVVQLRGHSNVEVERFEVTIRYRSGITTAHQLLWGTRQLRITGIKDPRQRHEKLVLTCEEAPSASTPGAST